MDKRQARAIFTSAAVIKCFKDPAKLSGKSGILAIINNQLDLIKKMAIEISQTDPDTAEAIDILLEELKGATDVVFFANQSGCKADTVTEYHANTIEGICNSLQGLTQLHDDTPPSRGKALLTRDQAVRLFAAAAAIYSVRRENQLYKNDANLAIVTGSIRDTDSVMSEIGDRSRVSSIAIFLNGRGNAADAIYWYTNRETCIGRISEGCQSLMDLAKLSQPHDAG